MTRKPQSDLRRGWTTGACSTAAVKAALLRLWGGAFPQTVTITLPRGETPVFALAHRAAGDGWTEAGIVKDAGDDPDVTHGVTVIARVEASDGGVRFHAGEGVGTVTKPGLPIGPGGPAINPVPRRMICQTIEECAATYGKQADINVTISIPNGAAIAEKTWNPRLGITGGLSILGTTGIVRPFSCSAWIASIHRGVDVARAVGLSHVAGCTGATSERVVQTLHGLPDQAMLDMGDFAGGLLKYLKTHPVKRLTIGGGIGKITKLAQGAGDLHSARSQVDFAALAAEFGEPGLADATSALHVAERVRDMPQRMADRARVRVAKALPETETDVVVVDRAGAILARSG
ncbi:MAG: cobalt-precorrin-5B (C(1))-methyltransferase [Rhodobacteraceae bacterium]|nr:cobalt-precorrin-5B (C(1))-methyltransferase [Paracoccaceae bacterium]